MRKTYIGTKMVKAEPMTRGAYHEFRCWPIPADESAADEGYLVEYADSHISWSPKWVFESAYVELERNPFLKTKRPSVSQEMVKKFISGVEVTTLGEKPRWCVPCFATVLKLWKVLPASARRIIPRRWAERFA